MTSPHPLNTSQIQLFSYDPIPFPSHLPFMRAYFGTWLSGFGVRAEQDSVRNLDSAHTLMKQPSAAVLAGPDV